MHGEQLACYRPKTTLLVGTADPPLRERAVAPPIRGYAIFNQKKRKKRKKKKKKKKKKADSVVRSRALAPSLAFR